MYVSDDLIQFCVPEIGSTTSSDKTSCVASGKGAFHSTVGRVLREGGVFLPLTCVHQVDMRQRIVMGDGIWPSQQRLGQRRLVLVQQKRRRAEKHKTPGKF